MNNNIYVWWYFCYSYLHFISEMILLIYVCVYTIDSLNGNSLMNSNDDSQWNYFVYLVIDRMGLLLLYYS